MGEEALRNDEDTQKIFLAAFLRSNPYYHHYAII
jgi:hypothetical protein